MVTNVQTLIIQNGKPSRMMGFLFMTKYCYNKRMNKIKNNRKDIALLVVRLIIGGIFIFSGYEKITDLSGTVTMFTGFGIPVFLTYIVAFGELISGILLVLGLWTCFVAMFLAIIMIVAVWLTKSNIQMVMTPLATLAALISLIGFCGGKYSIKCCCKHE